MNWMQTDSHAWGVPEFESPPAARREFELSSYQQAFLDEVQHGTGNVILRARAGAAKTTSILLAAEYLGPETLYCAYAKTIERELKSRLPSGSNVRTIYGLGLSLLKKNGYPDAKINEGKYMNLVRGAVNAIIDTGEIMGERVSDRAVMSLRIERPYGDILKLVDFMRLTLRSAKNINDVETVADHFGLDFDRDVYEVLPQIARAVMKVGFENIGTEDPEDTEPKHQVAGIDYTDMIWAPWVIKAQLGRLKAWRFAKVFCDEAQDLSPAQLFVVREMVEPSRGRLFFVGDDRQAITGYAGADTQSIDKILVQLKCKELALPTCYRCPTSHLELARELVPDIEDGPNAKPGEVEELDEQKLLDMATPGDMIICRVNAPLIGVCLRLIAAGKRATMRGRAFDKMLTAVVNAAKKHRPDCDDFYAGVEIWEAGEIAKAEGRKGDKASKIMAIEDRAACVKTIWDATPDATYPRLLEQVESLFSDSRAPIQCSSVHGAKGMEAERVFIVDPELMPLPYAKGWQFTQELNIRYVALTRSKRYLGFVQTKYTKHVKGSDQQVPKTTQAKPDAKPVKTDSKPRVRKMAERSSPNSLLDSLEGQVKKIDEWRRGTGKV